MEVLADDGHLFGVGEAIRVPVDSRMDIIAAIDPYGDVLSLQGSDEELKPR